MGGGGGHHGCGFQAVEEGEQQVMCGLRGVFGDLEFLIIQKVLGF